MVDLNDLSTWQLVRSVLKTDGIVIILDIELVISRDAAHLLFQASNVLGIVFTFNSTLLKLLDQRISNVLACGLELDLSMRESVALEYWYSV